MNILNPMIEKSVQIGEFIKIHRLNQNSYENRSTKKELNFVNLENSFQIPIINNSHKVLISQSRKTIFVFDNNSSIVIVDMESYKTSKISLLNIFEKSVKVIDVEYKDSTNSFYILYENLNFNVFDFHKYVTLDSKYNHFERLTSSKSKSLSLNEYIVDRKAKKVKTLSGSNQILTMLKDNLININLTFVCDRFLVVDYKSMNILFNIYLNPYQFMYISSSIIQKSFALIINILFNHDWSLKDLAEYQKLFVLIKMDKKNLFNFKQLAILLKSFIETNSSLYPLKNIQSFSKKSYSTPTEITLDIIYEALINLLNNQIGSCFNILTILENYDKYLKKLYEFSKIYEESSSVGEKLSNLLYRSLRRDFDLEKRIDQIDIDKQLNISTDLMREILLEIPIGVTREEINCFLDEYKYDENNNILYPYIFEKIDYQIIKAVILKKNNSNPEQFYGYFRKNNNKNVTDNIVRNNKLPRRKNSDIISEINNSKGIHFVKDIPDHHKLLNLCNLSNTTYSLLSIYLEIERVVFVPHIDVFVLTLSKETFCSKLCLFKLQNNSSIQSKIMTEFISLGYVETFSFTPPRLLHYIDDRNYIVTECCKINYEDEFQFTFNFLNEIQHLENFYSIQKTFRHLHTNNQSKTFDIVMIDIYKDIFDIFQTNNLWRIYRSARINNVSSNYIENFLYFPSTKLFLSQNKEEIKIINPKSKKNELSIKYIHEKEESVYDYVCRSICENPSENTGDDPCKIIKNIKGLKNVSSCKVLSLHEMANCKLDYLIFLQPNKTASSSGNTSLNTRI
jgi:hypothetical protein